MRLSSVEIARLKDRHRARRRQALRDRFAGIADDAPARRRYFDDWADLAEALEAIGEVDVLRLLEIGFRSDAGLAHTVEYQTCRARSRWYGRRLWLADRLERMGCDVQPELPLAC